MGTRMLHLKNASSIVLAFRVGSMFPSILSLLGAHLFCYGHIPFCVVRATVMGLSPLSTVIETAKAPIAMMKFERRIKNSSEPGR
jgi:hypothetical protein